MVGAPNGCELRVWLKQTRIPFAQAHRTEWKTLHLPIQPTTHITCACGRQERTRPRTHAHVHARAHTHTCPHTHTHSHSIPEPQSQMDLRPHVWTTNSLGFPPADCIDGKQFGHITHTYTRAHTHVKIDTHTLQNITRIPPTNTVPNRPPTECLDNKLARLPYG